MKTSAMRRGMRQMTIWVGRLTLATLLCLDGWLIGQIACDWPRVNAGPSAQVCPVDVGSLLAAR